jgi:hypothetical protein
VNTAARGVGPQEPAIINSVKFASELLDKICLFENCNLQLLTKIFRSEGERIIGEW